MSMHIDYLDQVNEIQHDERKVKAIFNSFFHDYIVPEQETALREIEIRHQDFTYTASVILDLLCDLMKKTDDLENKLSKETDLSA